MSKPAPRATGSSTKDGGASFLSNSLHSLSIQHQFPSKPARSVPADSSSDICPVCKSSRYLNPNMKFLVNPECYHKMCESCVDRIFSHGPAPCPIAGCKRTLRKAKFRSQTFEDLKVEREVDIRRRVARVMNKVEADFESLKDFNDYLESVETTTWNLILKVDVEATERRLRLWEAAQKAETNSTKRSLVEDPSLLSETSHVILKKGGTQRKQQLGSTDDPLAGSGNDPETGFVFHGLKKRVAPEPEKPYDPYEGWSIDPQYYVVQDDYSVDWLTKAKDDPVHSVGGYDMRDFYSRALSDAFSGFGVFIEDEKTLEENPGATAAVASGGQDVNMDDVF
ncbi:CDK-activating kinase assembly factor [Melanomma pulvis-pyrius CBS 109.77]|uniref:RNA polymerase II transcription factor B subunit 3 n=1 Tax=Melanomma pulvis-pyrius CBS 109.77 TaxID=1314802 RepID=A0A6A6XEP6_9PLEO|nr:CDK-activating kinase assembly factor [Melanomma pulvis-pyrius CBS 109.77]